MSLSLTQTLSPEERAFTISVSSGVQAIGFVGRTTMKPMWKSFPLLLGEKAGMRASVSHHIERSLIVGESPPRVAVKAGQTKSHQVKPKFWL